MPSMAPPTDDIDAEWGADEIPAAAPLPALEAQASVPAPRASSVPPRPASSPVAAAKPSAPAPRIPTPIPRPSSSSRPSVPAPAPGTPLVATQSPFGKQTLLGIAPVIPQPPSPPADIAEGPEAAEPSVAAAEPAAIRTPLTIPSANNSFRKQTLLGIAPVLPTPRAAPDQPPLPTEAQPVVTAETQPVVTAEALPMRDEPSTSAVAPTTATDAPTTADVAASVPRLAVSKPSPAAVAASPSSYGGGEDLPELKPKRARWLALLGIAAALVLGVVGFQQLDRAQPAPPLRPAAQAPQTRAAEPPAKTADNVLPQPESEGPAPREMNAPDSGVAPPAASGSPLSDGSPAPSAPPVSSSANRGAVRVQVQSSPPGARLFWKGKEVGTTPFTLELQPGEKHAYELGMTGYTTRKVVIDGSLPKVSIGLKPDTRAAIGTSRRKP